LRKSTKFEDAYDALNRIESRPMTEESAEELRSALNSSTSLLVSMAADIAGRNGLRTLIPEMIAAFERFMINGAKNDKQCNAKTSIVNALNNLGYMGDEVFPVGAYYIQMEPAFGDPVDTAVNLRCSCAYGLARSEHPEVNYILTDMLDDKDHNVRAAAIKALAYLGTPESEVLLRFKALVGDKEAEVISECFTGLMTMSSKRSLDFVARFLTSGDSTIQEFAALAIGASRIPRAYDKLRECWDDDLSPTKRSKLLLPIALVRTDEAFNFLLGILRRADVNIASEAISALSLYTDEESFNKIRETVVARDDGEVRRKFEREFGMGAY
jgi:HEAT repeat protein